MSTSATRQRDETEANVPHLANTGHEEAAVEDGHSKHASFSDDQSERNGSVDVKAKSQQKGVSSIEALHRVFGGNRLVMWSLYLAIFAVIVASTIDTSTTYSYQPIVASIYQDHATLLGVIGTATAILTAVSQPFIAKICDVFSRQAAFTFVIACNVLGYIIIASTNTVAGYAVGSVIAAVGTGGVSLVSSILLADLSPLEWRGFALGMAAAPYIAFTFLGAKISTSIIASNQWRWGYGMFAIIHPVCVLPVVAILIWAQRRARRSDDLKYATAAVAERQSLFDVVRTFFVDIDGLGLVLLAFAWCLILLPFSLEAGAENGWKNPSMIAMLVCGIIILFLFAAWEYFGASMPLVNRRIAANKVFLLGASLDFLYYLSGYLRDYYYPSYTYIVTNWTLQGWTYWNQITTVGLCFFGLVVGILMRVTHRYKYIQLGGIVIRTICVGLTIWATGSNATTAALVSIQIFNALGCSCSVMGTQIATQGSVPHQDLAQMIAQLSLWTRLGGAIGTSVAANVWTNNMPVNMAREGVPEELIPTLYGSITSIKDTYSFEDPIRQAAIRAYDSTVRPMFIAATVFTALTFFCALFMPDFYLGKSHNKIEGTDVRGNKVEDVASDPTADPTDVTLGAPSSKPSAWKKFVG